MADEKTALVVLPDSVTRRGITEPQWITLSKNLYPGANPTSVLMVWDYCIARRLDPLKKPVHIVPMRVKVGDNYQWQDVVMPGIYEYRITAHRTGEYLGHDEPVLGPDVKFAGVTAPEWCLFTTYRWNPTAKLKVPYPVKTFFAEVVAQKSGGGANERWSRAPKQMLTKCAEAASIREAFPEEIGGEPTAEEMDGQHVIDITPVPSVPLVAPPAQSAFERLPDGLQRAIEQAFTLLKYSPAQQTQKLTEYLGGESERTGQTLEDAAESLLEFCRDEYSKMKTGQPRAKGAGNGKDVKADRAGTDRQAVPGSGSPVAGAEVRAHQSAEVEPARQADAKETHGVPAAEIFKAQTSDLGF